jgi:four helix bundle protein
VFRSFEDLEVWKRSCSLAVRIYQELKNCSEYSLKDQMQRAAVSIGSNIAEGSERSTKDFRRFLTIAGGSAAELRTQVYIAGKIGIFSAESMWELVKELKEISKMLRGLSRSIMHDRKGLKEKRTPKTEHENPETEN